MRKQQEIELLDTMIQQTPRNSYLRSMLEHLRPQFQADIRSDFSTLPDIAELEREVASWSSRNKQLQEINRKMEQQTAQASETLKRAYARIAQLKAEVIEAGRVLENALNTFTKP